MGYILLRDFIQELREKHPDLVSKLQQAGLKLERRFGRAVAEGANVPGLRRFLLDMSRLHPEFRLRAVKLPGSERVVPAIMDSDKELVTKFLQERAARTGKVKVGYYVASREVETEGEPTPTEAIPLGDLIREILDSEPELAEKLEKAGLKLVRRYGRRATEGPNVAGLKAFLIAQTKIYPDFKLLAMKLPGSERVIPGIDPADRERVMEWLRDRAERSNPVEVGYFDPMTGDVKTEG